MNRNSLCLYVDGSEMLLPHKLAIGWAVVGQRDGEPLEHSGALLRPLGDRSLRGHHEHVAFVHAVLLAHKMQVNPEDLTLVCDCDIFGYAQTWLHPGNYSPRREQVLRRLRKTIDEFFDEHAYELVLQYMQRARIIKVKGHRFDVLQERADYLAKAASKALKQETSVACEPFYDWLARGFLSYVSPDEPAVRRYAPFTGPQCA